MSGMRLSRRSLLGSVGAASITPALPAVARDGTASLPGLPQTEPAFEGTLLTGPQKRMAAGQYSAAIVGGVFTGPLLAGTVHSGRIDWRIDAASEAMHVTASYAVLRQDGVLVQVKDRSVHPQAIRPAMSTRLRTAPEIISDGGEQEPAPLLVGLLDASGFSSGQVSLRAFRVV
jgi:hypothetical protein